MTIRISRDPIYRRRRYRYSGNRKALALGIYPDVPIARARSRHQAARQWLAAGVDPSLKRKELRGIVVFWGYIAISFARS